MSVRKFAHACACEVCTCAHPCTKHTSAGHRACGSQVVGFHHVSSRLKLRLPGLVTSALPLGVSTPGIPAGELERLPLWFADGRGKPKCKLQVQNLVSGRLRRTARLGLRPPHAHMYIMSQEGLRGMLCNTGVTTLGTPITLPRRQKRTQWPSPPYSSSRTGGFARGRWREDRKGRERPSRQVSHCKDCTRAPEPSVAQGQCWLHSHKGTPWVQSPHCGKPNKK